MDRSRLDKAIEVAASRTVSIPDILRGMYQDVMDIAPLTEEAMTKLSETDGWDEYLGWVKSQLSTCVDDAAYEAVLVSTIAAWCFAEGMDAGRGAELREMLLQLSKGAGSQPVRFDENGNLV